MNSDRHCLDDAGQARKWKHFVRAIERGPSEGMISPDSGFWDAEPLTHSSEIRNKAAVGNP